MNWFIPLISAAVISAWHTGAQAIQSYRLVEASMLKLTGEHLVRGHHVHVSNVDGNVSGGGLNASFANQLGTMLFYAYEYSTTANNVTVPVPMVMKLTVDDYKVGTFTRTAKWGGRDVLVSTTGWDGTINTTKIDLAPLPASRCELTLPKEYVSPVDLGDRFVVEPDLQYRVIGYGPSETKIHCYGRVTYVKGSVTLDLEFKPTRIDMSCRVGEDCTGTFNAVTRSDYQQFTHKVTFKMDPELSLYDFTSGSWHKDSFEFTAAGMNDRKFGFRVPDAGPGVRVYTIRGTAEYE
ncbi:hypothetical protein AB6921_004436 [Salmonella enterica]